MKNDEPNEALEPEFWRRKTLEQMSDIEWEALCDGCGRCCLVKLEDEDTGTIIAVKAHCKLLNVETCKCSDYAKRQEYVPDCAKITPQNIVELSWMPKSCAYRRLYEGRDLAWWHPLVSGSDETVHDAGISVRGKAVCESLFNDRQLEDLLDGEFDHRVSHDN